MPRYIIGFSFVVVTALVALLSWWRTRRVNNNDARTYFLADRKLPWIQVAGALLLTNLSTEQLIGLNGAASIHGAVVMAWEVVPAFALIAMAWFFLPRYWSGNITTVPEFLETRFNRPTRRLMGIVFLITIAFNILPFVLYSGGVAISTLFGVAGIFGVNATTAYFITAVFIGVIGCLYVVLGGMKAVAFSDTLYGAGLLVAGLGIPVLALRQLGHGDFSAGLDQVFHHQMGKINPVGNESANVPFTTLFTGMLFINLFYWCTNQMIVQRSFGAASYAEAQKGILATAALKLLGPFFLVFPGIIAAEMLGAAVGNGDFAYAKLVGLVLPHAWTGVFAAILFGSIISAYNGGLHSAATLFSLDLYRAWWKPAASDAQMVRAGKMFAVLIGIAAILVCPLLGNAPEGVFTLMKRIMAAFKLPLLAVVVMGMLTSRVPSWAAQASLIGGVVTYFLLDWLVGHGTFGITIHWLHLAAINTTALCFFMALAGWLAPIQPRAVSPEHPGASPFKGTALDLTPWRGLRLASLAVAAGAVALYYILWHLTQTR